MSNYGIYNFTWIRGTTTPLIMQYTQNGVPLPFDDARLRVFDKTGVTLAFELSLADNPGTGPGTVSKDIVTGQLTFHPTEEMTRALVQCKVDAATGAIDVAKKGKNRYEVELRNGADADVYLMGTIAGIGGLNDDEETPS